MIINYILGEIDLDTTQQGLADLNNDNSINIQDVILVVNLILSN